MAPVTVAVPVALVVQVVIQIVQEARTPLARVGDGGRQVPVVPAEVVEVAAPTTVIETSTVTVADIPDRPKKSLLIWTIPI